NLGTNGNQDDTGNNVTINGTLSTPRVGVGSCSSGNVTAFTGNLAGITGGLKELPQAVQLNPPVIPAPGLTDVSSSKTLCPTSAPSMLEINYAGTGQVKIAGNGASAAVVYAPNATASFRGNGAFYGSVIAAQVTDVGNGAIHYDRKLQRKLFTVGNYMLSSFTWSKF